MKVGDTGVKQQHAEFTTESMLLGPFYGAEHVFNGTSLALSSTNSARPPCFHGGIAAHTLGTHTARANINKTIPQLKTPSPFQ